MFASCNTLHNVTLSRMFAGSSGVTPSLWSLMGYDATVIRFEGPDDMRAQWTADKSFEFVWAGSGSIPLERSAILTHVSRLRSGRSRRAHAECFDANGR